MSFPHSRALAARVIIVCSLGLGAAIGNAVAQVPVPDPADAAAAVPATRYLAAGPGLAESAPADGASPAQNWIALNRQAGVTDSMALTMGEPDPAQAPPSVLPAPAPQTGAAADPHAGHKGVK